MTNGQSANLSWYLGRKASLYYGQTVVGLLMLSAFSDERMGLSFTAAAADSPAQSSLGPSPTGLMTVILLSQI
jgi:hypothetical protein